MELRELRGALLGIGLLALAVRVAVVLLTRHSFLLINDAADYSRLGASLASGHGFGVTHVAPGGGPTALRPPAFPLLVAAVYWLLGTHVLAARLVGAALGAVTAVLVAVLVGQLAGDRRQALTAGVLSAVFPPMVIASTSVMSEGLFVPLSLGVMVCALAYRQGGGARWLALSGLLLGLATLTRPIGAVLLVPVAVLVFTRARRPGRARAAIAAAALALAPCVAWEIRDVVVLHHVIPLTTQDGYFLAGTYNASSAHDRDQPGIWIVPTQDPATARLVAAHPRADEVRLNHLLQRSALDYLSDHPGYLATVLAYNFLRTFDLTSLSFEQAAIRGEYGYGSAAGTAEFVSTLAILVLALVGVARGALRRWPVGVWIAPLLLLAVTLPTRGNPRFRAPVDPYLVAIASGAFAPARRRPEGATRPRPPGGS